MERVVIDLVRPLKETSNGNRYVIVITDHFTKFPGAFGIPNKSAPVLAEKKVSNCIFMFGHPMIIQTDQGIEFQNELLKEICRMLCIKKVSFSAYHPQTNSVVERFNRTLCKALEKMVNEKEDNWNEYIQGMLFSYRIRKHSTTGISPYKLVLTKNQFYPNRFGQEMSNGYKNFLKTNMFGERDGKN